MFFVHYHPLKEKLRDRTLSDAEALPYFIGSSILGLLPAGGIENIWDFSALVVTIVLTIMGLRWAYKANGGAKGFDIIQKTVVLFWILGFRVLLFCIIPLACFAIGISIAMPEETTPEKTGIAEVIVFAIIQIIIWKRLAKHISDTVKKEEKSP